MTASATTNCPLIKDARRIEAPLIAELAAAVLHLEYAARTASTPDEQAAFYQGRATNEQLAAWVNGNADRIRTALDTITAPYTPA
jgi:hypothetical protein